jgi:hypothetical protein
VRFEGDGAGKTKMCRQSKSVSVATEVAWVQGLGIVLGKGLLLYNTI